MRSTFGYDKNSSNSPNEVLISQKGEADEHCEGPKRRRSSRKTAASTKSRSRSASRGRSATRNKVQEQEQEQAQEQKQHTASSLSELSATGILNIVADTVHNFTDGIMIGAVFAGNSRDMQWSTFLAVMLHEVPHELADFAILVQSGYSKTAAIHTQFATAIAAFVGTFAGYYIAHSYQEMEDVLVALVSGGFLYLATTNILPLTRESETSMAAGPRSTRWTQMVLDLLAFGIGVGLMVAVAFLEIIAHEEEHAAAAAAAAAHT